MRQLFACALILRTAARGNLALPVPEPRRRVDPIGLVRTVLVVCVHRPLTGIWLPRSTRRTLFRVARLRPGPLALAQGRENGRVTRNDQVVQTRLELACDREHIDVRVHVEGHKVIEVSQSVSTSAERVFAVLADGWLYPLWVVGATHMRDVDPGWPAVGTRIHHCVGPWPLNIRDATTVVAVKPGRMLELDARVWPTGAAKVRIVLTPVGDNQTHVTMGEIFDRGPGQHLPTSVQAALMRSRNIESLRRLADIAEHRDVVCTPYREESDRADPRPAGMR